MSVARGAEQQEQQPGEVGDRNDVHLEDVAQLVAREVRDVPPSAIPAEWTRASRWEIRRAARAVASSSARSQTKGSAEGGRRPVRPPLTCGPDKDVPVTPEVLGDRATDAAAAAGDQGHASLALIGSGDPI